MRFMMQYDPGHGDYTEERRAIFADLSIDDIFDAIDEQERSKASVENAAIPEALESTKNNKQVGPIAMKAIDTKTFAELEAFAKELENRPTERLLRDLPALVKLPEAKVSIISYIIGTKYRNAKTEERRAIRKSVMATSDQLPPGEERTRVQDILERLSGMAN